MWGNWPAVLELEHEGQQVRVHRPLVCLRIKRNGSSGKGKPCLPPVQMQTDKDLENSSTSLTQFVDLLSHCAGKGSLRRHFGLPESQMVSESQTFPSLKQVALQGSMPREHEAMEDAEPPDPLPTET